MILGAFYLPKSMKERKTWVKSLKKGTTAVGPAACKPSTWNLQPWVWLLPLHPAATYSFRPSFSQQGPARPRAFISALCDVAE